MHGAAAEQQPARVLTFGPRARSGSGRRLTVGGVPALGGWARRDSARRAACVKTAAAGEVSKGRMAHRGRGFGPALRLPLEVPASLTSTAVEWESAEYPSPDVVTFVVTSASNAPRTPRAPRTDVVFLFASLSFATARRLPTAGRVERMAQSSSARVSGPVLQGLRGRPDPVAPPLDGRGEFARAFTSPLRRAFRTCEPRQLRRADRGLRA